MGLLENSIAFVFVLGVMVLIHELGHYVAARYFDVKVEAFSIGFGPRLFGFQRGETDFKVCVLPLGGFVKMAGENPSEPSEDARSLLAKPRWQRLIIAFMGPLFNIILAILLPIGLFMFHYERLAFVTQPALIGYVKPGSPAHEAGIRQGDRITALNGTPTPTWESVTLTEITAAYLTMQVEVERHGERLTFPVKVGADERTGIGTVGWSEQTPVRLKPVAGSPAERGGVQPGDRLVSIAGEPVLSIFQVPELVQRAAGSPVTIEVLRAGQTVSLEVVPEFDRSQEQGDAWRIGVEMERDDERVTTQLGFFAAARESIDLNLKSATLIFRFLGGLVEQRMSPKSISGPIGIAQLSGEAARRGWPELVGLMAAISLNLGILNLLPIPILDGGVITLLLFESAIRKDVSLAVKERIVQVGFVFLMLLFAFVMYNDIMKSFGTGG
jgi:regulator of sigma E protease